jgi:hypothetical protein
LSSVTNVLALTASMDDAYGHERHKDTINNKMP